MNEIIGSIFAIAFAAIAFYYGAPQVIDAQMQPAQDDAGNQIAQMQSAGSSYIRNHASTLVGSVPVGGNIQITPAQLVTDGDLDTSFADWNVFAQKHVLVISQPSAGVLDGMVYTYGGDTISDSVTIRVAQAGPANATVVISTDTTNFEGAAGGENVPIAHFQNATYPVAAGHIGAHILSSNYATSAPWLNRYATGSIADNTMNTAQYMAGNNLNMASTAAATTGGGSINMAGGNLNNADSASFSGAVTVASSGSLTSDGPFSATDGADVSKGLTVSSGATSLDGGLTVQSGATLNGGTTINTSAQVNGTLSATGNITSGANVQGSLMYANEFFHLSDVRLKENMRELDPASAAMIVRDLKGYTFNWKKDGSADIGFKCQEVRALVPLATGITPDGYCSVKYDLMGPIFVQAHKYDQEKIDGLEERLAQWEQVLANWRQQAVAAP